MRRKAPRPSGSKLSLKGHARIPNGLINAASLLAYTRKGQPKPIGAEAIAVYAVYASRASRETGHAWPAIDTIAETLNLSRTTVKRAIAALVAAGWLTLVEKHKHHETAIYHVNTTPQEAKQTVAWEPRTITILEQEPEEQKPLPPLLVPHEPDNSDDVYAEEPERGGVFPFPLSENTTLDGSENTRFENRGDIPADGWLRIFRLYGPAGIPEAEARVWRDVWRKHKHTTFWDRLNATEYQVENRTVPADAIRQPARYAQSLAFYQDDLVAAEAIRAEAAV